MRNVDFFVTQIFLAPFSSQVKEVSLNFFDHSSPFFPFPPFILSILVELNIHSELMTKTLIVDDDMIILR